MSEQSKARTDLARELWGSPASWSKPKSDVEVARKLGVDVETVRNRVKRMKQSGYFVGWMLAPNPFLLGRTPVSLLIEFEDASVKEKAIELMMRMEGVTNIASNYGNSVEITVFDDSDGKSSQSVRDIDSRADVRRVPGTGIAPTSFRMTTTDWRIIRLMLRDAKRRIPEVAAELRIAPRTLRRRLRMMMDASAVLAIPMVDHRRSNEVSYRLNVDTEDGKRPEVDTQIVRRLVNLKFKAADSENGLIYGFSGRNVTEGKELVKWIGGLPGVKSTRINIIEEVVYLFEWLESEIERQSMRASTGQKKTQRG